MLIREDYRDKITREFSSIYIQDVYEQTFPILTPCGETCVYSKQKRKKEMTTPDVPCGETCVYSKLGKKETDTDGSIIAWGSLQCVEYKTLSLSINIYAGKSSIRARKKPVLESR